MSIVIGYWVVEVLETKKFFWHVEGIGAFWYRKSQLIEVNQIKNPFKSKLTYVREEVSKIQNLLIMHRFNFDKARIIFQLTNKVKAIKL